ncbi:Transposase [Limihaloglobus sulfuriphilus]|uniref:Transposase n=1 Tax=Limihaloglobus sulfuriphilus TaxID=1851148 RepID=A0A1R7T639_9BACT|nr:IS1634 family transposase [Limihaloglobus sulfuriphilus]AQQ72263.1 Transposase [Limihaloglobus sulfuriphilus]
MRVKTSKNSPKRSVQIVESYRNEKNQPRQRIVRHLGTAFTDKELERLRDFAQHEIAKLETEKTPSLFKPQQLAEAAIAARSRADKDEVLQVNLKKLCEESRFVTGIHEAFGMVYDEIGFESLFGSRNQASAKNLRNITMARIANPESKRASVKDLSQDFGLNLSLDGVYRMMDRVDEKLIEKAQKLAYESAKSLLNDKISVIFYDCTTLYFESFSEDELKKNGYSKDMKFNQPQVVLGLMATSEGLTIGYEVFLGNQYEGHTLKTMIPRLKQKYNIQRVIFTADSAMLSRNNLEYLETSELEYIVAARLKNLDSYWTDKVTGSREPLRSFDYGQGRRLIVTYNDKLARKNSHDRDKAIDKLQKKLEKSSKPESLISNYGYKRFLKIAGNAEIEIDQVKYAQAARFDGLHGVITNVRDLSDNDVIEHYHGLWQIENCFRVAKHDLQIRPVYHWTPRRIRAHILICFLALTCLNQLSYRLKLRFEQMSAGRMINALNHIQVSILYHTGNNRRYVLPSKFNEDARKIYKTLGLTVDTTPYRLS